MSDTADATLECFDANHRRDEIALILQPWRVEVFQEPNVNRYAIEAFPRGQDDRLCVAVQALGVSYVFFQCGDHEEAPRIRFHAPLLGEWSGLADVDGTPVVPSDTIDAIVAARPDDADETWLTTELAVVSGEPWRQHFANLAAGLAMTNDGVAPSDHPRPRRIDVLPQILASDRAFSYVTNDERYLVIFAVSYGDESDPTDTGERIASARDAAHWALELTRDGGSPDTPWTVHDSITATWTTFEQHEIEEA